MRIAVTGANGQLGSQVVQLLAAEGDHQVVAISRRKAEYEPPLDHVRTVSADYGDRAALREALRDTDTLVFVSSDGEATNVLVHHYNVIRAAADAGVGHIVALSGIDADVESPFCYAVTYGYTERALHDSGCRVSIARASIYTEFFMRFLLPAATSGQIRLPAADSRISLVSRTDVSRCLAALAVSEPTGRHHDVTGPESLDLATIAALTEDEWGMPVRYVDLTPSEHRVEMARSGEEAWWQYAFSTMFDSIRDRRWTTVTDEIARLTGRRPLSVREVLAQYTPSAGPPVP